MKIEEMISKNRGDCCGCESCANTCPKNAIKMIRDSEGFAYPEINHEICIECGKCDASCPSLNFHEIKIAELPKVFVAINPNEKIRRHSSSGGFFSAISEIILNDGGIIFGAGFDDNWRVKHMSAENFDELENLRRSKYVQSQIGDTYKNIKKFLESGRKVLFSGTACQCAGLKKFLGRDFDNLLTLDVMCHGTPSPMVWENYIDWRGQGHEISHVNFRHKPHGFKITYKDCGYYSQPQDLYMQCFSTYLTQRKSCHICKFRFPNNFSDMTCGDAWGIENYAPELNDNRGASIVIIHTDKGAKFFDKADLKIKQVGFENFPVHNPNFLIPAFEDSRRANFFAYLEKFKNPVLAMQKCLSEQNKNNMNMQNAINMNIRLQKIFSGIAQNRERNIFVITNIWRENFENMIMKDFFAGVKNIGFMVANTKLVDDKITMNCYDLKDKILKFGIQPNVEEPGKFFADFNITDIFIIRPLEFDEQRLANLLSGNTEKVKILQLN